MKESNTCKINHEPRLAYNYEEAAYLLSISTQALRTAVSRGSGPRAVYKGRRVFFLRKDLEIYVNTLAFKRG